MLSKLEHKLTNEEIKNYADIWNKLVNETRLSKEECSSVYDIIIKIED